MAETTDSIPTSTPVTGRKRLAGGLFAIAAGSTLTSGITAGLAASVEPIPTDTDADAALLSLRAELLAAVADVGWSEMVNDVSDEKLSQVGARLLDVCWEIVGMPPAQTAAGRALKAAGAMHQFRHAYSHGVWPGTGEAMAWDVLSQIAGDAYTPPAMPERLRAMCEPARASA